MLKIKRKNVNNNMITQSMKKLKNLLDIGT